MFEKKGRLNFSVMVVSLFVLVMIISGCAGNKKNMSGATLNAYQAVAEKAEQQKIDCYRDIRNNLDARISGKEQVIGKELEVLKTRKKSEFVSNKEVIDKNIERIVELEKINEDLEKKNSNIESLQGYIDIAKGKILQQVGIIESQKEQLERDRVNESESPVILGGKTIYEVGPVQPETSSDSYLATMDFLRNEFPVIGAELDGKTVSSDSTSLFRDVDNIDEKNIPVAPTASSLKVNQYYTLAVVNGTKERKTNAWGRNVEKSLMQKGYTVTERRKSKSKTYTGNLIYVKNLSKNRAAAQEINTALGGSFTIRNAYKKQKMEIEVVIGEKGKDNLLLN